MLFPFLPYALSLSLSISYKQMRYTKVPTIRKRAQDSVQTICNLLDQLKAHFYAAEVMSKMGRATLDEMSRVYRTIDAGQNENSPLLSRHGGQSEPAWAEQCSPYSTPNERLRHHTDNEDGSASFVEDVFAMFDPNFRLEDVDDLFQNSLDLSIPSYFA